MALSETKTLLRKVEKFPEQYMDPNRKLKFRFVSRIVFDTDFHIFSDIKVNWALSKKTSLEAPTTIIKEVREKKSDK